VDADVAALDPDAILEKGDLSPLAAALARNADENARLQGLGFAGRCHVCNTPFAAVRRDARYCSARCRQRASRAGLPRWRRSPA
jgi:hypothetical protein